MTGVNKQLFKELKGITKKMDIPEFRLTSIKWLLKNIGIRNSDHPRYDRAMEILKTLNTVGF